jgi:phosphoglycolate phosphatase-like HAD superfamily hydrolase
MEPLPRHPTLAFRAAPPGQTGGGAYLAGVVTPRLAAVLLDLDGTLVDSNEAHARSWTEALRTAGFPVAYEEVRARIGEGGDQLLPQLAGVARDSERGRAITARRTARFLDAYVPGLRPFAGVRALLERMRAEGLRLFVITSAPAPEAEALLDVAGVRDLIDPADRARSGAAPSKPGASPDANPCVDSVRSALARARVRPEQAVLLGDTPCDVAAARRERVPVIALRSGGWDDDALSGAQAIYDDATELLAHFDESPLATPAAAERPHA